MSIRDRQKERPTCAPPDTTLWTSQLQVLQLRPQQPNGPQVTAVVVGAIGIVGERPEVGKCSKNMKVLVTSSSLGLWRLIATPALLL